MRTFTNEELVETLNDVRAKEREYVRKWLDSHICWECADTRPLYAHQTCQSLDLAIEYVDDYIKEYESNK